MDPAQQQTPGRLADPRRRAPCGDRRGEGATGLTSHARLGAGFSLPKEGERGKSPSKHRAAGSAPKLTRRPQKVRKSRGLTFPSPGARPARRGWGAGPGPPLGAAASARLGRSRGSGAAGPTCARARGARRPLASRRRRLAILRVHSGCVLPRCQTQRPERAAPRSPGSRRPASPAGHHGALRLRRTRPGRALPAAFPPVPPPPPHPCRYVSVPPPSRDTPPAGHSRSSQGAVRCLQGRARVPRRVTPKSENSV